jgi:hypothetical protein
MAGIGKQLRGSGLAKSGFKSKYDVVSHERKGYADGSDQEGVQPDRNEAQQKAYDEIHSQAEKDRADIVSNRQQREDQNKERKQKTEDDIYEGRLKYYENQKTHFSRNPSSTGPKFNKFFSKYVDDPIRDVANKVIPGDNSYDKANRKARKDVLGYKEGGSTRPGLWANINKRKKLGISRPKSKSTISSKAYANMKAGFPKKKK